MRSSWHAWSYRRLVRLTDSLSFLPLALHWTPGGYPEHETFRRQDLQKGKCAQGIEQPMTPLSFAKPRLLGARGAQRVSAFIYSLALGLPGRAEHFLHRAHIQGSWCLPENTHHSTQDTVSKRNSLSDTRRRFLQCHLWVWRCHFRGCPGTGWRIPYRRAEMSRRNLLPVRMGITVSQECNALDNMVNMRRCIKERVPAQRAVCGACSVATRGKKTGLKTLPASNLSKEMNERVSFHRGLKISVFPGTESSEKNEKQFNTRLYLGKKGSGLD